MLHNYLAYPQLKKLDLYTQFRFINFTGKLRLNWVNGVARTRGNITSKSSPNKAELRRSSHFRGHEQPRCTYLIYYELTSWWTCFITRFAFSIEKPVHAGLWVLGIIG
uniref:Uncharacterized protein n=1 Tax=Trichogramma kaykai TaxID=54128 RepID=A0ABD2VZ93_9HYME